MISVFTQKGSWIMCSTRSLRSFPSIEKLVLLPLQIFSLKRLWNSDICWYEIATNNIHIWHVCSSAVQECPSDWSSIWSIAYGPCSKSVEAVYKSENTQQICQWVHIYAVVLLTLFIYNSGNWSGAWFFFSPPELMMLIVCTALQQRLATICCSSFFPCIYFCCIHVIGPPVVHLDNSKHNLFSFLIYCSHYVNTLRCGSYIMKANSYDCSVQHLHQMTAQNGQLFYQLDVRDNFTLCDGSGAKWDWTIFRMPTSHSLHFHPG